MVYNYPARYNDEGKYFPEVDLRYPLEEKYDRCGVIPYYFNKNGNVMFVLGVNRDRIKQVTSFGGKSNDGESWKDCSIREFNEESYNLICKLSEEDIDGGLHLHSQKCVLTLVKISTIDEYYPFELIKSIANVRYMENMKSKKSDRWETFTFEEFSLIELESLIKGSNVNGYELWNLDRIMLIQKWDKLVAVLGNSD